MNPDLRVYIKQLEDNDLVDIIDEKMSLTDSGVIFSESTKALLFKNVDGYPSWQVCGELIKNKKLQSIALGCSQSCVASELSDRLRAPLKLCKTIHNAPVQDTIISGDEVDLHKIPILTHSVQDAGPYIGGAMCVTKDPETGKRNVAFLRLQLQGKNQTGVAWTPFRHTWMNYKKYSRIGKPMPMAAVIGHHPLVELAACWTGGYGADEFGVAGSLLGEELEMVQCSSIDLEVPAYAELVLEGEVPLGVTQHEGPFGEFTGYFKEGEGAYPIFRIKAVTMRNQPIYRHLQSVRFTDHQALVALPMEARIYNRLKEVGGNLDLKTVYVPTWGSCFEVLIQITPHSEGEARAAILAAFSGEYTHPKVAIVVDDDVNVEDPKQVFWSIATRCDPGKDVMIFEDVGRGHMLDPSLPAILDSKGDFLQRSGNKMGIIATKPPTSRPQDRERFEQAIPTGALSSTVQSQVRNAFGNSM